MPSVITAAPIRSRGTSHATAVTAVKAAIAIPSGATSVKVEALAGDMYVGVGSAGTSPDLDTTNSVIVEDGTTEVWSFNFNFPDDYLYVDPVGASCEYRFGFYK